MSSALGTLRGDTVDVPLYLINTNHDMAPSAQHKVIRSLSILLTLRPKRQVNSSSTRTTKKKRTYLRVWLPPQRPAEISSFERWGRLAGGQNFRELVDGYEGKSAKIRTIQDSLHVHLDNSLTRMTTWLVPYSAIAQRGCNDEEQFQTAEGTLA